MTVLSMYRNGILRFYQGVDQFDLFLTGMTGYMYVLENNVCTLHGKLIDNTGNCLFISRDQVGTEHDRIVRFDRNFLCMPHAIRDNAAMDSPWLPVVIITVFSSG